MYKYILFLASIVFINNNLQAQAVKWYSFQEAIKLNEKAPRKIVIDVYTDWCGWCKVMDKETFQQPEIAKILNEKYYPVKFNAESTAPVIFQGHTFINDGQGQRPPHQLAVALLQGKLSYPSIVFMDEKNQLITAMAGFQKPAEMEPLLMFIYGSLYEKGINFQEYVENYAKNKTK